MADPAKTPPAAPTTKAPAATKGEKKAEPKHFIKCAMVKANVPKREAHGNAYDGIHVAGQYFPNGKSRKAVFADEEKHLDHHVKGRPTIEGGIIQRRLDLLLDRRLEAEACDTAAFVVDSEPFEVPLEKAIELHQPHELYAVLQAAEQYEPAAKE